MSCSLAAPAPHTHSSSTMKYSVNDMDLALRDLGANYARGLDVVTRAIHGAEEIELAQHEALDAAVEKYLKTEFSSKALSVHERNQLLATLVRGRCIEEGFLAAWSCLVEVAPNMGMDPRLVEDACTAANVYERLKSGERGRDPVDLKISIGPAASYDSIERIGPKSLGGTAWRVSEEYNAFLTNPAWSHWGYAKGIPPCVAMGWIGVQMKVTPPADAAEVVKLQLLGTVDFDMDYLADNQSGFQSGFDSAALYTRAVGTKLQGAALIGMLNFDLQNYIRPIQNRWAVENNGAFNLGPADVSPKDWVAYLVADCAALVPFAYDKDYSMSRTGMINGMVQLQCQDLLFDTGCSNRVATVPYVQAAGVAKYGIHAAYAIAAYEATATYFLNSGKDQVPPFGYSSTVVAGPWGPFGTRYRVWERCVKYMHQLKRAKHPEAKALLDLASGDLILKDYSLEKDVGDEWARAMQSDASDLIKRPTVKYFVEVDASDLFGTPGVDKPELCDKCGPVFEKTMASMEKEEIHAAAGLPPSVTVAKDEFGRPASLAAGFRRAAMWACSDECCDVCASRIGNWIDAAAYSVLTALMHDEPLLGPSMWMLQNYFVGCVAFWPVSLPFLLSGFDLLADMSFEDGAMGTRDVVDI
ncbi:hypothetical protein LSUE1_G006581 [Lachnellula suecica]|uniref:Uncharacterized protein n=1 Tax=Lachnellula suecica TaxID=602035 RepID=A0A8T9BY61_9HELO|nr:hypothetical protein LSUE1_G006581 [Lachnellula suecica]